MSNGFPVIPHVFQTKVELEDYLEWGLNNNGHEPVQSVVDEIGQHWLASRAAPGGDGYDFYFVLIDGDTGYVHECNGDETGCSVERCNLLGNRLKRSDYGPRFPVLAWIQRGVKILREEDR